MLSILNHPLILWLWFLVHDATVSHNALVIGSIILVLVLLILREKSHRVWQRRRWLLRVLDEPSILVAADSIPALHVLLGHRYVCKTLHDRLEACR